MTGKTFSATVQEKVFSFGCSHTGISTNAKFAYSPQLSVEIFLNMYKDKILTADKPKDGYNSKFLFAVYWLPDIFVHEHLVS